MVNSTMFARQYSKALFGRIAPSQKRYDFPVARFRGERFGAEPAGRPEVDSSYIYQAKPKPIFTLLTPEQDQLQD